MRQLRHHYDSSFRTGFNAFPSSTPPRCRVMYLQLGARACCLRAFGMLIGARNPTARPIHVCRHNRPGTTAPSPADLPQRYNDFDIIYPHYVGSQFDPDPKYCRGGTPFVFRFSSLARSHQQRHRSAVSRGPRTTLFTRDAVRYRVLMAARFRPCCFRIGTSQASASVSVSVLGRSAAKIGEIVSSSSSSRLFLPSYIGLC